jgi:hypothetical protein
VQRRLRIIEIPVCNNKPLVGSAVERDKILIVFECVCAAKTPRLVQTSLSQYNRRGLFGEAATAENWP